ncbi:MAG: transglycosylase SLT domain-containing protein [Acidobacteriaceae bacterium]
MSMLRFSFLRLMALTLLAGLSLPLAAAHSTAAKHPAAKKHIATPGRKSKATRKTVKHRTRKRKLTPAQRAKAARMKRAFVASSQLRPMAQQLLENRTPPAYAAVEQYARSHRGSSAGTMAWLAIGYAHLVDNQSQAAIAPLESAKLHATDSDLGDYASLFLARALSGSGQAMAAATALSDFGARYPDSVLKRDAALARTDALVSAGEAATAVKALEPLRSQGRADVELAIGKAYQALGDQPRALAAFTHIYTDFATSSQANDAANELRRLNPADPFGSLSEAQRLTRTDLLYKAHRYGDAADELRALLNQPQISAPNDSTRRSIMVRLAGALYKSKRESEAMALLDQVAEQPIDDAGAQRLFLKAEEARNKDDGENNRKYADHLFASNPKSIWTQEALLSAGNMYLLRKDYPNAIKYFLECAQADEKGRLAGYTHWKGAWLTYRTGDRNAARSLFLEQIAKWPAGQEMPAALYWSARLASEDGRRQDAKAYYAKLLGRYRGYYYGVIAASQLQALEAVPASNIPELERIGAAEPAPELSDAPEDDPRVAKARLLTNAALNDYAMREMKAAQEENDGAWVPGELARLYISQQRPDRALRSLKSSLPGYFTYGMDEVPRFYWETLFPRPYWNELRAYSLLEGLDPYLVASLIRQESEFNPSAVSGKDAYGLMQLLPSVAKSMAKELKIRHWKQSEITNPQMNLRLGIHYFRTLVNKYNGQVEYALAAYNAGDNRVSDWRSNGDYHDIYEFVESIPFTETREYVQAIERNSEIYAELYKPGERVVATAQKPAR